MLATSGIDDTVGIWEPTRDPDAATHHDPLRGVAGIMSDNQASDFSMLQHPKRHRHRFARSRLDLSGRGKGRGGLHSGLLWALGARGPPRSSRSFVTVF